MFVSSSVSFLLAAPIWSDTTPRLTRIPLTPDQRLWREVPAALAEVGKPVTGALDLWVAWTYWSGGGKHGEPESIGWIEEAYLLTAKIELKPTIVLSVLADEKED